MSLDYGFRISEEGKDVKTCSDLECVVTSKYPVAKGGMEGIINGSKSGYLDDGIEITMVINHNLGYIPRFRLFSNDGGELPVTEWQDGSYLFDAYYEHTNLNTITVHVSLWADEHTHDTLNFAAHYYVSLEKVNI